MKNALTNLFGNKKVKSVEAINKELEKVNNEIANLEAKRSEFTDKINEVTQAIRIVKANLVIDSGDKNALATKTKGEKLLETLKANLAETETKLTEAREQAFEKNKELHQSQGEAARKVNVFNNKKLGVVSGINTFFDVPDNYKLHARVGNSVDLAQAYGLGDFQRIHPQEQQFIISLNSEDNEQGKQEAEAIVKEALQAMVAVLEKYDIQLIGNSSERLKGLGVELKV